MIENTMFVVGLTVYLGSFVFCVGVASTTDSLGECNSKLKNLTIGIVGVAIGLFIALLSNLI